MLQSLSVVFPGEQCLVQWQGRLWQADGEQVGAGSAGWVFAGRQKVPSTMLAGTFGAFSTAGALEQRG